MPCRFNLSYTASGELYDSRQNFLSTGNVQLPEWTV
jgi:hypothetical protein